ncbi:MAG TPA: hypothetical protein VL549_06950 [Gemmatimonadales bacterium]|nr:hypothetical protein [Gemmatimonadales bacterium]
MSPRPEPTSQAMPLERAILWNPPAAPGTTSPGRPSSRSPYPIFFQQEAVIALQDHLKSSPTQAIFGFLIGDVYRDPETGVLYVVIDKTLKLSQPIYGDKTEVVVGRLWDRMQEQLTKAHANLLGWYHSHPGQGGFLTAHDVETHDKYFTDPWHVAVLVAAEAGGVTGRFFRSNKTADWNKVPLPFYELLQPESIKPDGKKRSFITWRNYKPYGPTLTGPKPKPPEPPAPPPPPLPKDEEPEEVEAPPPRKTEERPAAKDRGFRVMRSSADDIPVIKSSADDEPAPAPVPIAPPPPLPPPAPPPPRASKTRPAAPVFVPEEPAPPQPPPPPPPRPAPPPPAGMQRTSDGIPWEVAPEEVSRGVAPLSPAAPPAAPRRTSSPKFRLLDQDVEKKKTPSRGVRRGRRRGGGGGVWGKRILLLLIIGGLGAGAYWYFALRNPAVPPPWAGLLDRAKQLVSKITSRKAAPPPPATRRTSPRPSPVAAPSEITQPIPPPPPITVASPFDRFDRLSDSLTRMVRNFQDRAALFANGRMDCGGLANGLVAIENLWISYNTERKARMASFDPPRVARDQALWASVDSVSRRFDDSRCQRP